MFKIISGNNYVLSIYESNKNDAGSKAKSDIDYFLKEYGFKILHKEFVLSTSILGKLKKLRYLFWDIPKMFKEHKMDSVVIQYPIYSSFLSRAILKNIKKNNIKLYMIIHDIESLRLFSNNKKFVQEETKLLNMSDGLISHNFYMSRWLRNNGVTSRIVDLNIFDYKNPQLLNSNNIFDRSICFAGNLNKAEFLTKMSFDLCVDVYGPNPGKNYPDCVLYKGVCSPEELPKYLNSSFGLVWDGTTTKCCDGIFGEYMKYNNPHKVSLYISSGLPVIIWKKAAMADYIIKNSLGIAVDSLDDVEKEILKISQDDYVKMKNNVMKVAENLRKGYFVKNAIEKLYSLK